MLKIENLNKNFGRKKVLKDFTYSFEPGVYGLLGPNGSGKTTLLRCITGVYNTPQNTIFYNDKCIKNNKLYFSNLGYLPQKFGLFKDLKVIEMMQLLAGLKDIDFKEQHSMLVECLELVNLSDKMNDRIGTLSGGMVRRLGIAQALIGDPDIVIFDEPTVGLDPEERLRFKSILSKIKKDKVIILSTHIVEDVEAVCEKILVIKDGKVGASGSCFDIQSFAKGKTYLISDEEKDYIEGNYVIQEQKEENGNIMLRIISNQPQRFEVVEPSVEDGYICILKEI